MSVVIRSKLIDLADKMDRRLSNRSEGTPCFLGQVIDGGNLPTTANQFYLVNPVLIDGVEAEGASASFTPDPARKIAVCVLGSAPLVGDILGCYAIGGRWVAYRPSPLNNCNPKLPACPGTIYSVNGTVEDPINGTQPIVYDFAQRAWYSAWLPYSTAYALTSGADQNPCFVGNGTSYYFYVITAEGEEGQALQASLFLPGQTCLSPAGAQAVAFFGYPGPNYPGLLGQPASTMIAGLTLESAGSPTQCSPLGYKASWVTAGYPSGPFAPFEDGATFAIPPWTPPAYGYTCSVPCPLPRKDLTLSWTNATSGPGSGTLTWNVASRDWTMACAGGLTARLYNTGSSTIGFTATYWDGPDCTGTQHPYSYPASIGLATGYSCEPLDLTFTVLYNTSALWTHGFRTFTVTE